ncbi:Hypothetical protein PHPALM_9101 [Phytophthora palmivora]|uniref:Transmembrane protein n=1 Tax=Phytophthora palmivora TaxID=4796 RepID=A0A2P4Y857_9STRA|nr:Hypothetical protein PHPALM_9101 [Phytophthora palmivora]
MPGLLVRWVSKLHHIWKGLQVSYYGGKYSIHRLLALEAYTKNTSLGRVLIICILTPLPMVAFVSIQALVPLQDPTAGWRSNFGFWIRSGILSFMVAHTLTTQATYIIDDISISSVRLAVLSACTSILFTAFAIGISAMLIFPVPFFVLTLAPVFYVALIISYRIVLGITLVRQALENRDQMLRFVCFVGAQNLMVFTYPAYETLFRVVKGSSYQIPVILLLPFIKVAVKNLVLRCMASMEDMLPEAVIFTVDFFNAVYVATCMQSANSATAITAITVTDLSQTTFMLFGLHQRTGTILSRLCQTIDNDLDGDNLVSALCILCRNPQKFLNQVRNNVHIRSCLPLILIGADNELLDRLESMSTRLASDTGQLLKLASSSSVHHIDVLQVPTKKVNRKIRNMFVQKRCDTIHPLDSGDMNATWAVKRRPVHSNPTHQSIILRETLEALFTTECIVVTAYLEAIVPLFYCCYMLVMTHLPSAHYHTEMTDVTPENVGKTVIPVFVFGMLQIATFVLLAVVIKRNCGMRILYQLAFVLETQMPLIQGKLIFWVLITLCFRVVHFGVDFTFHFSRQGYRR